MSNLIKKIERAIENKAMETGKMGNESVTIEIQLSTEEVKEFKNIEKFDNEHYFWTLEGNTLTISYTEEV